MHREFSNSYTAKFVIEKKRVYVENANRATGIGYITKDNLEPNPKNPIIVSFFRNIGYADQLGSGVHNLFKYSKYYSGQEPEVIEGDVFRIIVPLDEEYSFDFNLLKEQNQNADKMPIKDDEILFNNLTQQQKVVFEFIAENGQITSSQAETLLDVKQRRARIILGEMVDQGLLERQGSYKSTIYVLKVDCDRK